MYLEWCNDSPPVPFGRRNAYHKPGLPTDRVGCVGCRNTGISQEDAGLTYPEPCPYDQPPEASPA
jgi:hypothetical protein